MPSTTPTTPSSNLTSFPPFPQPKPRAEPQPETYNPRHPVMKSEPALEPENWTSIPLEPRDQVNPGGRREIGLRRVTRSGSRYYRDETMGPFSCSYACCGGRYLDTFAEYLMSWVSEKGLRS
jgi:hypothetical protein